MRTRRSRTSTRTRIATPEQRKRAQDRKRRARNRKGMTKEDKKIANAYRLAIAKDPCFYCGEIDVIMHVDHFYALARGGTSHWYNLVRACSVCNYAKRTKCGLCFQGQKCRRYCRPKAVVDFPGCVVARVSLIGR